MPFTPPAVRPCAGTPSAWKRTLMPLRLMMSTSAAVSSGKTPITASPSRSVSAANFARLTSYSAAAVRFTCPLRVTKSKSGAEASSEGFMHRMFTGVSFSSRPAKTPLSSAPRSLGFISGRAATLKG